MAEGTVRPRRAAYAGERHAGAVGCEGGDVRGPLPSGKRYLDAERLRQQGAAGAGRRELVLNADVVGGDPGAGNGREVCAVVAGRRVRAGPPGVVRGAGASGPVGALGGRRGGGRVRGGGRRTGQGAWRGYASGGRDGCGRAADDGEHDEEEHDQGLTGRRRVPSACRTAGRAVRSPSRGCVPRERPREGGHLTSPDRAGPVPRRRAGARSRESVPRRGPPWWPGRRRAVPEPRGGPRSGW